MENTAGKGGGTKGSVQGGGNRTGGRGEICDGVFGEVGRDGVTIAFDDGTNGRGSFETKGVAKGGRRVSAGSPGGCKHIETWSYAIAR